MNEKTGEYLAAARPSHLFDDVEKGGFRPRSAASSPLPAVRPPLERLPESLAMSRFTNNAPLSVAAYCMSSISMTLVNKYVVSGKFWNLTFFYLTAQVSEDLSLGLIHLLARS